MSKAIEEKLEKCALFYAKAIEENLNHPELFHDILSLKMSK